jgi:hypothetical protein
MPAASGKKATTPGEDEKASANAEQIEVSALGQSGPFGGRSEYVPFQITWKFI